MQADDARLIGDLVSRGAVHTAVPADAVAAWRERTEGVTREFATAHREAMRRLRAVVGVE